MPHRRWLDWSPYMGASQHLPDHRRSTGVGAVRRAIGSVIVDPTDMLRRYQLLGLRFDRIEPGFVDAFTGDPALRRQVEDEPAPAPADLAAEARLLLGELAGTAREQAGALTAARSEF